MFYVKPLVRNFIIFYMSDHINAVYSNVYPVAIICAGKPLPRDLDKHCNIDVSKTLSAQISYGP